MAVLRMASPEDAAVMREIYAPYITETSVTFETEVPSVEEMAARMRSVLAVYPWIAAEENGEVVGYAYAHRAGERAAYGWNAELSVYVRQDRRRAGLGRQLCTALLALLRQQRVQTVYSLITSPNPASEALHRRLGFRPLAVHRQTGYKQGRWRDVQWMELVLGGRENPPAPVLPVAALPAGTVAEALAALAEPVPQPQPQPIKVGGRYRHFKGKEYRVLALATDSETGEPVVVYRALYGEGEVWTRPAAIFAESVCREGRLQPRFALVPEAET